MAESLGKLGRLTNSLADGRSEQEAWQFVASAQLDVAYNALVETISALKETKQLVKSKRLARLRRKLQVLVDEWPGRSVS